MQDQRYRRLADKVWWWPASWATCLKDIPAGPLGPNLLAVPGKRMRKGRLAQIVQPAHGPLSCPWSGTKQGERLRRSPSSVHLLSYIGVLQNSFKHLRWHGDAALGGVG